MKTTTDIENHYHRRAVARAVAASVHHVQARRPVSLHIPTPDELAARIPPSPKALEAALRAMNTRPRAGRWVVTCRFDDYDARADALSYARAQLQAKRWTVSNVCMERVDDPRERSTVFVLQFTVSA